MLSMTDEHGKRWDVVVGKASFGNMAFLFSCADSDIVLHHTVRACSRLEAERALRKMSDREICRLLRDALPWTGNTDEPIG